MSDAERKENNSPKVMLYTRKNWEGEVYVSNENMTNIPPYINSKAASLMVNTEEWAVFHSKSWYRGSVLCVQGQMRVPNLEKIKKLNGISGASGNWHEEICSFNLMPPDWDPGVIDPNDPRFGHQTILRKDQDNQNMLYTDNTKMAMNLYEIKSKKKQSKINTVSVDGVVGFDGDYLIIDTDPCNDSNSLLRISKEYIESKHIIGSGTCSDGSEYNLYRVVIKKNSPAFFINVSMLNEESLKRHILNQNHIYDIHKTTKEVFTNGRKQDIEGVVFNVDQSKKYKFYLIDDPGESTAILAIDQWDIGQGPADFVEWARVDSQNRTYLLDRVDRETWFVFGGRYVNHESDRYGYWVDFYINCGKERNARFRFEIRL